MQMGSHNTNEFCGDGTTTSTIIANSIFEQGLKCIKSGYNPVLIKRGIEKAKKVIADFLDDTKFQLDKQDEVIVIRNINFISKVLPK